MHNDRLKGATRRMRRIRTALLPPRARRTLTEVAGVTAGIYGAEVTALPAEMLESFRTAALNAWWGHGANNGRRGLLGPFSPALTASIRRMRLLTTDLWDYAGHSFGDPIHVKFLRKYGLYEETVAIHRYPDQWVYSTRKYNLSDGNGKTLGRSKGETSHRSR